MLLKTIEKILNAYSAVIPRRKPSQESMRQACFIAHRGAHNKARGIVENTLAAFQAAQDLGYWGIELDVHATHDQVLVVNHDPTLKRLWGQEQAIAQLTFNELRTLVPEVPSLAEVVAAYGHRMHLLVELKAPFQDEQALVQALDGLSAARDYHLLTLDAAIFKSLTQFPKQSLLLVSVDNNVREFCDLSIKENYGGVLGHYLLLSNTQLKKLKAAKKISGVGFVDSKYSLYRELTREVNWIFTDHAVEMSPYVSGNKEKNV